MAGRNIPSRTPEPLLQDLRRSDEQFDPNDPDFSPLGANAQLPIYLQDQDPDAPNYGYNQAVAGGFDSADAGQREPPPWAGSAFGSSPEPSPLPPVVGGGGFHSFDIEATPPRQSGHNLGPLGSGGGASGGRRLARRASTEEQYQQQAARQGPWESYDDEAYDTFPNSPPGAPQGPPLPPQGSLFGAAANKEGFHAAIHVLVHRMGRRLGFQAFNMVPGTEGKAEESWTPATIFVVTDHLHNLLVQNLFRRDQKPGKELDRFQRCVTALHHNIMEGYDHWCEHVGLPMRVRDVEHAQMAANSHAPLWEWKLEELALYFLLYTEAANLRHLPECLWFLYWIMRNSPAKMREVCCPPLASVLSAAAAVEGRDGLAARRVTLRNDYKSQIMDIRQKCGIVDSGAEYPTGLKEMFDEAKKHILSGEFLDPGQLLEGDLDDLREMIVFGDCGNFLDKIVTPLFRCLAFAVDKQGGQGVEIASRMGYDDFNECFARKDVVHKTLEKLAVTVDRDGLVTSLSEPLTGLLAIGLPGGPTPIPREAPHGVHRLRQHRAEEVPRQPLPQDLAAWTPELAQAWWQETVLGKTFIECRSVLMLYRAFFRVIAFHILLFQLLASLAWTDGDWFVASITLLTHAALSLVDQYAGFWTQRPAGVLKLHGRPAWRIHLMGMVAWAAINTALWFCFVWYLLGKTRIVWYVGAGAYGGLVLFHGFISSRRGYAVSSWHEMADSCQRFATRRHVPSALLRGIGGFLRLLGSASSHPSAREYLAPLRMRIPYRQALSNILFWIAVLALKVCFDYFVVIRTLKSPMQGLWRRRWLSAGPDANQGADGDIVLVLARGLPAFLLTLVDTGIFYSVVSAIFGALKGLVWLNLGIVSNFQELRDNFHKGPSYMWNRCISQHGATNITRAISNQSSVGVAAARHAPARPLQQQNLLSRSLSHAPSSLNQVGALPLVSQPEQQRRRTEASSLAGAFGHRRGRNIIACLQDGTVPEWMVFSDCWNAIVTELHEMDLISKKEKRNLMFILLQIDDTIQLVEDMRPFLLPIFFYAGKVNAAAELPSLTNDQVVALKELRALLTWAMLTLGVLTQPQAAAIQAFVPLDDPGTTAGRQERTKGLDAVVTLLKTLKELTKPLPKGGSRKGRIAAAEKLRSDTQAIANQLRFEAQAVLRKSPVGLPRGDAANNLLEKIVALESEKLAKDRWEAFTAGEGDGFGGPFFVIFAESPDCATKSILHSSIDQLSLMLMEAPGGTAPKGEEASRILAFFLSSLKNPQLKRPPPVQQMLSLNTLTPHYGEDVIYSLNKKDTARALNMPESDAKSLTDLLTETDGVSQMTYIRSLYPRDWDNFLERMGDPDQPAGNQLRGIEPSAVSEEDFCERGALRHLAMELQLWAAYRGQQLARTVRGMMAYEDALRQLAELESPHQPKDMSRDEYDLWLDDLIRSKYTYVVASQVYGKNKTSSQVKDRWLARGVEFLLFGYPNLRTAYIDGGGRNKPQWSVLIRGSGRIPEKEDSAVEEVYRVRLPSNPETGSGVKLGEGKPENQNAAIIFCFNEALQAIDMNQDNFLAEAYKIRNLVSEFTPDQPSALARLAKRSSTANGHNDGDIAHGLIDDEPSGDHAGAVVRHRRRKKGPQPIACVGMREWIFTENSGALASFAAATEFTFGTIVQRVMAWPGGVRFHYGHPDLWNRLFIMTRGGVSKATRSFHISEDVFAGYNAVLRGASIKFLEYIQVGKGRDMGFDSINGFEAKVAGGNGEQAISRDVYRLGTQFDFWRLLSWYHTGPGFFINTYLIFLTVSASIWVYLLLALSDSQTYPCEGRLSNGTAINQTCSTITGQAAGLAGGSVLQIGLLTIATYFVELLLERGFVIAVGSLLYQFLQGSIMFGIFRSRTSGYYFKEDVQHGGAAYIATGRGYALTHQPFTKIYSSYARSHLYYGIQLVMLLVLLLVVSTREYLSSTWGAWLVAICLLVAPFWFNPGTFSMSTTKDDFDAWRLWMSDVFDASANSTWYSWNKKQLAKARNEGHPDVGRPAQHPVIDAILGFAGCLPTALLVVGAITQLKNTKINRYLLFGIVTGSVYGFVAFAVTARWAMRRRFRQRSWRISRMVLTVGAAVAIIVFAAVVVPKLGSSGSGFRNVVIILFANFQIAVIAGQALLYFFSWWGVARYYVDLSYRSLDYLLGYTLFGFLFFLSFLGFVGRIQSALLFNVKFAKSLKRGRLLGPYVQVVVERLQREREVRQERELLEAAQEEAKLLNREEGERQRASLGTHRE